ncbi:Carbohydrate kinase PfkB domain-containing protein [Pleurotus pulmonarius]
MASFSISRRALQRACRRPHGVRGIASILNKRDLPVDIHPEVEAALAENRPVVALETAVVTHGFPYPENAKLAKSLEDIVRKNGSTPATVGLVNGRIKIGLQQSELEMLAEPGASPVKISRRDIAAAIVAKANGGTTCCATLIFAALAGIKVFATGGLGGVHRGGENTMDVSADLGELTRCPVGLVSAGVKSILDIGRTLEYLETLGVPVISYGKTTDFPAFFSPKSGFQSPWNVDNPLSAAQILYTQHQLGLQNGALIACPIPEQYEAAGASIQKAVEQAVAESEANGVNKLGKAATPWLLKRIGELTKGESLASNIALLENTAAIGGQIAVQYAKLAQNSENASRTTTPAARVVEDTLSKQTPQERPRLLIVGCAAIDISAQASPDGESALAAHSTIPGSVSLTLGGVGRNIAEAAHRLSPSDTKLISAIGDDSFGRLLLSELDKMGLRTDGLIKCPGRTSVCNMTFDSKGHLVSGVADMDVIAELNEEKITKDIADAMPSVVSLDGNLKPGLVNAVVDFCRSRGIHIFFEPTSLTKATAILPAVTQNDLQKPSDRAGISISPNLLELDHIYTITQQGDSPKASDWETLYKPTLQGPLGNGLAELARREDSFAGIWTRGSINRAVHLLAHFEHILLKCGERGVVVAVRLDPKAFARSSWAHSEQVPRNAVVAEVASGEAIVIAYFPALVATTLVNVTGAGDSFVGALLTSMMKHPSLFQEPKLLHDAIHLAQQAAILTLASPLAVSPEISKLR